MNERIRELAEQSGVLFYRSYYDPIPAKILANGDVVGKFAELIVKDVAGFCFTGENYLKVLKHFGVGTSEPAKLTLADALAMGREDFAHTECPDDCSECEHYNKCVYPVMEV